MFPIKFPQNFLILHSSSYFFSTIKNKILLVYGNYENMEFCTRNISRNISKMSAKLSATQSLLSASVRPLKNWARDWAALKVLMSKLKPCFWIVFLFIYFVYCTRCACVKTFKFHHVRLPLTRLGQSIAKTAWMSVRWLLLSSSL